MGRKKRSPSQVFQLRPGGTKAGLTKGISSSFFRQKRPTRGKYRIDRRSSILGVYLHHHDAVPETSVVPLSPLSVLSVSRTKQGSFQSDTDGRRNSQFTTCNRLSIADHAVQAEFSEDFDRGSFSQAIRKESARSVRVLVTLAITDHIGIELFRPQTILAIGSDSPGRC